ncbi:MAG: fibronectin type III domain-containing protein, partial [bacterium]|nr:fibronectin type III domain-containing protein [bacterium]
MHSDMLLKNRRAFPGFHDIIQACVLSSSKLIIQLLLVAFFIMNCDKEHKTIVAPEEENFPGAPIQIQAMVDDGKIFLVWDMTSAKNIRCYHIYRKDSVQAKMQLTDSTFTRQFTDTDVKNGYIYYYQISALNNKGYEGKRSPVISAIPNLFAVIIENGDEYINKTTVTLSLTAPLGTGYMSIASDSLFTNSTWENYVSRKIWQLSPGDGEKYVYVKFRDNNGNNTPSHLFDKIILDTKATISEVTENTNAKTKVPGQVIHFKLTSGEANGEATIDISDAVRGIKLYDDGTNGDAKANNGTYEVDYTIPLGLKVMSAIVTGHFKDRVSNQAQDVTAPGRVTIQQDPLAVTLYPPAITGSDKKSLELYWSPAADNDFASYRLYRKTSSGVDTSAASTLIATIQNRVTTNHTDSDVKDNTNYYYRVFVFDKFGKAKGSNEVMGKLDLDNEKPTPVILLPPTAVENSLTSLTLTWSKNQDDDFESYRIYRATAPNAVDSTSFVAEIIYDQNIVNYEDTGLKEDTEYNYQIYVFDTDGKSAGSNKEKGRTNVNESPTAVTLLAPTPVENSTTSLTLSWSKNADEDFKSYRIYRTETPQHVDSSSFLVEIIYNQNTTSYENKNLTEGTEYNYRVYVFDEGGKSAGSNTAKGKTNANEPPVPVTLLPPSPVGNSLTSLSLTWSKNVDKDFASYRIYRTLAPQKVDSASFLVGMIYNQSTTNYEDTNLKENTEYNYRIYVFDSDGKATGSNTEKGKTNVNEPPAPVSLLPPSPVGDKLNSLYLTWSKNADNDFASYRIYRSEAPQKVDSTSFLVNIFYSQATTNYEDTNLKENTEYNYRVYVFDTGGKATGSNTEKGKTNANQPPTAVILTQPAVMDSTTLRLNWSQNDDLDFEYYSIYRSESSPVDTLAAP